MTTLEAHLQSQLERDAGSFWHRLRWRAMSGYVDSNSAVALLDVGAGTGILGEILAVERPHADYSFIEPVQSFADQMERRWGVDRNASECQDLEAFSVVTFLDVIEHVPDDAEMLGGIVRRLQPGTRVIVTVPALPALWSQWDVALGHYRRYTRTSLRQVLDGLPVHVDEVSYLFPELVPLSFVNGRRRRAANAEWPTLPKYVDETLYRLGAPGVALRRFWPFGTSVFAALRRQ